MTIMYFMPGLIVNGHAWSFAGSSVVTENVIYTRVFGINAQSTHPVIVQPPKPVNDNKEI